jgi:hypothetical protein
MTPELIIGVSLGLALWPACKIIHCAAAFVKALVVGAVGRVVWSKLREERFELSREMNTEYSRTLFTVKTGTIHEWTSMVNAKLRELEARVVQQERGYKE